ncbi:MAG: carbohydrate ABC transporter permease [Caldilinea sp.]|jgi:ABC-type glycerol-3-phosphate transport system permease component|nr:carbohydrate ABC transporter permease [Caldilinea sp.]
MTAMTDKQTQTAQEARQLRQRRRLSDGARTLFHYVLLTTILLIVVVPLMWAVAASFTPNEQVFRYVFPFSWRALFPSDPTLDAYLNLFQLRDFGGAIANTLALSVGTVAVGLLISAMAGFAFAKFEFRGKNLLFVTVLITFMIPVEVIIIPLYILMRDWGWINTWHGLFIPGIANGLVIFMFRQFFADIPQEILDAARVDGASWLRILFQLIIPISLPAMISGSLVLFLGTWNSFFWPLVVAPAPELRVVQVAVSLAVESRQTIWNELMAGAILAASVPVLLVFPFQRYYVRSIASTGIK